MGTTYNPAIVTDGLVLCLDAANKRSYPGTGTTWSDLVGANDGTLTNGPTFDSENGGAIFFDSSNEHVSLGTPSQLNQVQVPLTVMVWANLYSYATHRTLFSAYKSTSGGNLYSLLRVDSQNLKYFGSSSSGGFQYQNTGLTPDLNVWNFYAVVVSGTISSPTVTLYLNESSSSFSYSAFTTSPASNVDFRIGGNESSGAERWHGLISTVGWYNRALSADEIRQNYEATVGRYT